MNKKSLLAGLLVVCFVFGIIAVASYAASNPNVIPDGHGGFIVYPTATYPTDSENVQWAANNVSPEAAPDNMPLILLKATGKANQSYFDFGTVYYPYDYRVDVQKNCIISGEVGSDGKPKTKIVNGAGLFSVNMGDDPGTASLPPQASRVIIKDLKSDGGTITFCGVYELPTSEVEASNIYIDNFSGNPNDYPALGFFTKNTGKFTVKNCYIRMVNANAYPVNYAIGCPTENSEVEITGNVIITNGNAIGLLPCLSSKVYNNKIFAKVGIHAGGSHNSLIQSNTIESYAAEGITLEVGIQLSPGLSNTNYNVCFNTIEANTISASNADYWVKDSIWFPLPAYDRQHWKVDLSAYPHTRNNRFLNPLGSGNKMVLENIEETTLRKFDNEIDSRFNIIEISGLENNLNSPVWEPGPNFINMDKAYCKKNGGTWDPVNQKCDY